MEQAWEQLERTGRVEWVSDLADIPAQYGVKNVYGDLGQIFAPEHDGGPACFALGPDDHQRASEYAIVKARESLV